MKFWLPLAISFLIFTGCTTTSQSPEPYKPSTYNLSASAKKGATVKNSVIMNQCVIEEGAFVEYAILDKETKVMKQAKVTGTSEDLFISEKKQIVAGDEELNIV